MSPSAAGSSPRVKSVGRKMFSARKVQQSSRRPAALASAKRGRGSPRGGARHTREEGVATGPQSLGGLPDPGQTGRGGQVAIGRAGLAGHGARRVFFDEENHAVFDATLTQQAQVVQVEGHDLDR